MPIDIIPVGAVIEEVTTEDIPLAKRGRGRPKASLNKPKVVKVPDPPPEEEQEEEQEDQEEEPEEE